MIIFLRGRAPAQRSVISGPRVRTDQTDWFYWVICVEFLYRPSHIHSHQPVKQQLKRVGWERAGHIVASWFELLMELKRLSWCLMQIPVGWSYAPRARSVARWDITRGRASHGSCQTSGKQGQSNQFGDWKERTKNKNIYIKKINENNKI